MTTLTKIQRLERNPSFARYSSCVVQSILNYRRGKPVIISKITNYFKGKGANLLHVQLHFSKEK